MAKRKLLSKAARQYRNRVRDCRLKALVAQRTHRTPPRIHALWRLAEIAGVEDDFTAEQVDTIADLSVFQVEGRYPTDRTALLDANPPARFKDLYDRTKEALSCLDSLLR